MPPRRGRDEETVHSVVDLVADMLKTHNAGFAELGKKVDRQTESIIRLEQKAHNVPCINLKEHIEEQDKYISEKADKRWEVVKMISVAVLSMMSMYFVQRYGN